MESHVTIFGESNVRAVVEKASGLSGYVDATWWGDRLVPGTPAFLHLEIPVARLTSGDHAHDNEFRRLLSSRSFPNIVTEVRNPTPLETPNRFAARYNVGVRGTTRVVHGELEMRQRDGRVSIDGEETIDLRDFDIRPPQWLWFRLSPQIRFSMHVVAALAE